MLTESSNATVCSREESTNVVNSVELNAHAHGSVANRLWAAEQVLDGSTSGTIDIRASESFVSFIFRSLNELRDFDFATSTFVFNNLRRRYRRSVLGFAWSLLNPLLTMTVMAVVFSMLFNRPIKSYALFIFSGMLPWTLMNDSLLAGSQSIVYAEHFLKKVFVPKLFFPLVSVSTETANFLFAMVSLLLLSAACGLQLGFTVLLLPVVALLTFLFAFGLALALSVMTVYFRDLTHILQVLLTAVFYLIPIVYPLNLVPSGFQKVLLLNPFYYFISLFREIIYEGKVPTFTQWAIPTAITLTALVLGFTILKYREKDLIYRL
ncbi:MAG: ABC transporter permease [Candidatus Melainabacteria bacterium]|nr:ABC transporter permease [Candidatus Melainabacteria bacterium]